MELTEETVAEIAAKAAAEVVEKTKEMEKKIEVGDSPEEKLIASKTGGFKSLGHFAYDVVKADTNQGTSETLQTWSDTVRKEAGTMEEGDLAQGGYLVPEEFGGKIDKEALETAIVKPRARVFPMKSNRITFAADVDYDHSADFWGGVTIYRTAEGAQKTPKNPTYERIALTLHKLTGLCYVSDELLEDSVIALESELVRKFGEAIAFQEDDDYLNGNGVNQALGCLNSSNPSIVTVTAVSGQGAATIIAENIRDMWCRMYPRGMGRCIWLANIETFPQLFAMEMAVGTGGVPVWLPAGGMSGLPYQTLMGKPLIFTEKCQALGTAGDIALVDLSQYAIGQRGGVSTAQSIHIHFDYDETAFRFVLRYDGQPTWLNYLTPKRGSNTLSPFIVLNSSRT